MLYALFVSGSLVNAATGTEKKVYRKNAICRPLMKWDKGRMMLINLINAVSISLFLAATIINIRPI